MNGLTLLFVLLMLIHRGKKRQDVQKRTHFEKFIIFTVVWMGLLMCGLIIFTIELFLVKLAFGL